MVRLKIIGMNERVDWETALIKVETDGVNPVSVKLLDRDYKYIYTFIKKNTPVKATDVFERFSKMDVESILYDLREMYLVYFVREME